MKIVKRTSQVERTYSAGNTESAASEKLVNVKYDIIDNGVQIGSAEFHTDGFSMYVTGGGRSIEDNIALIESMFNSINEEE